MGPLILIVENDAATQRLLRVLMHRHGWDVDAVLRGDDAELLIEHVRYAAIVLDLLLPGRSGYDILGTLAAADPALLQRVLVISSAPQLQLDRVKEQYAALTIVRKPFELADLEESVRRLVESHEPQPFPEQTVFVRGSLVNGASAGVAHRVAGDRRLLDRVAHYGATAASPMMDALRESREIWGESAAAVPVFADARMIGVMGWNFREQPTTSQREALSRMAESSVSLFLPLESHERERA